MRRLIDLAKSAKRLNQYVRLNREARADIEWWHRYAESWNGTAMMSASTAAQADITVRSDASGNWGCGAYCKEQWFMLQWSGPIGRLHITIKELAPVVIAAALWGGTWKAKSVLIRCDNAAVVSIINHGASRNPEAMQLTRCLSFLAAKWEFHLRAEHIRGVDNILADALSRNNLPLFRVLHPQASPSPSVIPEQVLDLLMLREPDWTCRCWTGQWSSIFGMA